MVQNLLIVDDEYDILVWLKQMFQENFDMEIGVYTASCGVEALTLMKQIKFEVVLTDIRMPAMDGITLFQEIKGNWPRCKIVFLTGYRSFDDMYRIVNHKDVRFVLKSERDEVICQAVREAFDEFQRELDAETLNQLQKEELEKARYWICKDFMNDLLNGEDVSADEVRKKCAQLELPIALWEDFLMFLVRLDPVQDGKEEENLGTLETIDQLIRRNLPGDLKIYLHRLEQEYAMILVQPVGEKDWSRCFMVLQGAIEYAQKIFRRNCHRSFSAVLSSRESDFRRMPGIMVSLKRIMVGYLGDKEEVIVHAQALESESREQEQVGCIKRSSLLKSYLELGQREKYFELLTACCREMEQAKGRHDTSAMGLYYSVAVQLLQFISENGLGDKVAFHAALYKLTSLDAHGSWKEATEYLFQISTVVFDQIGQSENALSGRALQRVTDYIEENPGGDLSLTRLADIGGFNASYLSRLFKQKFKVNLTAYIFQKRMERAEELLSTTQMRIQDVGMQVGYPSAQYFTRSFRNYAGLLPTEYRELHRKQ